MNGQLANACTSSPADQSAQMVNVAVDAAIGAEPQQVQGAITAHHPFGKLLQHFGGFELVVANGVADSHQLLSNNSPSADGEVPHLGVAHLLIRQTHMGATGFDQCVWVGMPESLHHRGIALTNGVVLCVVSMAPTVQNGQYDRCNSPFSP